MALTIKEVSEICRLASINVNENEVEKMKAHIDVLISILDEMEKVDTEGVIPFFELSESLEPVDFKPVLSEYSKDIIDAFTQKEDDYLVVKKVVDKGE